MIENSVNPRTTPHAAPMEGHCAPGFELVRRAMAENFAERDELGAACAIYVGGEKVVDIWGGHRDPERSGPWLADTLVGFYSVGKPLAALCALRLVERGLLDLEAPVATWWPEFATAGKQDVTLRQLLCHRAGLPAIRPRMPEGSMLDWQAMTRALAAETPWWRPATRHVYHTNTYGFLVGEIVRRVTGQSIGSYFRREVADPLGVDLAFGLPDADLTRVADLLWDPATVPPQLSQLEHPLNDEQLMIWHGWMNPSGLSSIGVMNTRAWRQAEVPSTNGHGTARGIAKVYAALAAGGELDGVQIIGPAMLAEATRPQSVGPCPVLKREVSFGLGFQTSIPSWPFGPNARSFGHMGTGCSLGFADPDARIGFGYVTNYIVPRKRSARCDALIDALYACL